MKNATIDARTDIFIATQNRIACRQRVEPVGGAEVGERMKAAVIRAYGGPDVVRIETLPAPVPRKGLVGITVKAAAVTRGDARIRAADAPAGLSAGLRLAFGLRRPRQPVLGMFFSGRLAEAALGLPKDARVFGKTGMAMAAHAEALVIKPERILPIPDGLGDAEAAALFFGGLTAADFLIDKAGIGPDTKLLINGATGEVGCAAIQIARFCGAEITAVCRAANHDLARDLGADHVHDYRDGAAKGQWDVIMDIAGTLPWRQAETLLAPGGMLLPVTASLGTMIGAMLRPNRRDGRRISGTTSSDGPDAMLRVLDLHSRGALRPVIGATFALEHIEKAHALAESGHKRGSVVVVM